MPSHPTPQSPAPTWFPVAHEDCAQRITELEARLARLEEQMCADAERLSELAIPEGMVPTLAPDAGIAVRWEQNARTITEPKAVVD